MDLWPAGGPGLPQVLPEGQEPRAERQSSSCSLPAVDQTAHVIDFLIRPVSAVILPQVFDGGDGQDEEHGGQSQFRLESLDQGDEVQQSDEDEVDVGEPVELLEEVLGQEGQQRVLGGLNLVVRVGSVRVLLPFGAVVEKVGVDEPAFALLRFLLSPPGASRTLGRAQLFLLRRHRQPRSQLSLFARFLVVSRKTSDSFGLCYHSFTGPMFVSVLAGVQADGSVSSMSAPLIAGRRETFCLFSLFLLGRMLR